MSDLFTPFLDRVLTQISNSLHTRRNYFTAMALLIQHMDDTQGDTIPANLQHLRPLACRTMHGRQVQWRFNVSPEIVTRITPDLLDSFTHWRQAEGDSPSTIALRLSGISSVLAAAHQEGILPAVQAEPFQLPSPRTAEATPAHPRILSADEVNRLRNAVDTTTVKGKRDMVILDGLLFMALERPLLVNLTPDALQPHPETNQPLVHITSDTAVSAPLPMHLVFARTLANWVIVAEDEIRQASRLLLGVGKGGRISDKPLHAADINRIVAEYGQQTGVGHLTPDDLRRTAARTAYDNGAKLIEIQAWLRLASLTAVANFIQLPEPIRTQTPLAQIHYNIGNG